MVMNFNGHGSRLIGSKKYYNMPIDTMDPMYKIFLEHIREDGKSYVLEMENGDNGSSVFVRYEQQDMLTGFPILDSSILDSHTMTGWQQSFKENGDLATKMSSFRRANRKSSAAVNFLTNQAENTLVSDSYADHCSPSPEIRTPDSEHDKSLDLSDSLKMQCEDNLADDSYQEFLSCLKVQDDFMVMEYNSVSIVYERDEINVAENLAFEGTFSGSQAPPPPSESSQPMASHKHTAEESPCSKNREIVMHGNSETPEVIICEGDYSFLTSLEPCNLAQYDAKLNSFIRKPYDQHEHEELWEQVNFRNPVVRHKDLRSQCKSYKTRQLGLSYLDHFPDLAKKLERADPPEALKLLRGFFFWLKNLCHEGAYRPWVSERSELVEVTDNDMVCVVGEEQMEIENSSAVIDV